MSLCLLSTPGAEAIPLLVRVIQAADSRSKENVNATENCISAVGKVMRFRPECANVGEILPHWLNWLPLNEDKEEAVHTFDFLCDLIERWDGRHGTAANASARFCQSNKTSVSFLPSNNPIVLGQDNSNLPKIFCIIADGVANESVKSEDACSKRLANVIRQVQVSIHSAKTLHPDSNQHPRVCEAAKLTIVSSPRCRADYGHSVYQP